MVFVHACTEYLSDCLVTPGLSWGVACWAAVPSTLSQADADAGDRGTKLSWVLTEEDSAVLQSPGELTRRERVLSESLLNREKTSFLSARPRPAGYRAARGSAVKRVTCLEQVNLA